MRSSRAGEWRWSPCTSAGTSGSAVPRLSCLESASATTRWWRRARWSRVRCPRGRSWAGTRQGSSKSLPSSSRTNACRAAAIALLAACLLAAAPARAGMPRRATSFVNSVGVNVHMSYFDTSYDHWQKVRDKLSELGVRHVRDGACPGCKEQRRRLLALGAAGIRVDYIMGRPGDPLSRFVDMLAGPMRSTVDAVEGPNEYDASGDHRWASRLRSYQRRLYRLVKRRHALTGVPVFGPTLVSGDDFRRLGSLRRYADFGNVHPYSGGQVPAANLQYNRHVEEL